MSTYFVIRLCKDGKWKPADDCAYTEEVVAMNHAEKWANRKGNPPVRVEKLFTYCICAQWDAEGKRII